MTMKLAAFLVVTLASCASAHYGKRTGLVGGGFGSGRGHVLRGVHSCGVDVSMTTDQMRAKLVTILTQTSTDEVINLTKALMMPEGQRLLSWVPGLSAAALQDLINQIQNPNTLAQARTNLNAFAQIVQNRGIDGYLSSIFGIYDLYLQRQAAILTVQQATSAQLLTAIQAFKSQVGSLSGFNATTLNGMISNLQNGGTQGYNTVVSQLTAWINMTNCSTLKLAGAMYTAVVGPAFTPTAGTPSPAPVPTPSSNVTTPRTP